jgi:muconolactone delta-isomerase
MAVFMVESTLPPLTQEFASLIPEHREVVNKLFTQGKLMMYAVSDDRAQWWCCVNAEDEFQVMEILAEMPIMPYLKPEIKDLMFYNGIEQVLPPISLN